MSKISPVELLEACGDKGRTALENFSQRWEESMTDFPGAGRVPFLQEEVVRDSAVTAGFSQEAIDVCLCCAKTIQQDELLARLAWHAYWRVFLSPEPCGMVAWPEPPQLGGERGVLYLLVALGFVPLMREHHRSVGIPDDVIADTAKQVWHYCADNYMRGNDGRFGVYQGQLNWLRHYTRQVYVRLGRMEFWLQPTTQDYRVYRNKQTGECVVFLPNGETLLTTGYYPNDNTVGETFQSVFGETKESIYGTPCVPGGYVSQKEVCLDKRDWKLVLQKDDSVLAMHIPSGGGMTPEACRDAFLRAKAFFAEHFPEQPPKAIICTSWIFNTQLQEILPPEANLCRLQRMVHLFPAPGTYGLWFVFLKEWPFDPKTVPLTTSLQRRILDYLQHGHDWRIGQMVILMDEIA